MPEVHFFWKKTCTTSKRAREYLLSHEISLIEHNIMADPPPREFLEKTLEEKNLKSFLNTRSSMYRSRNMGKSRLNKEEIISLMLVDPNLIKRPVIICENLYSFGFRQKELDKIISRCKSESS